MFFMTTLLSNDGSVKLRAAVKHLNKGGKKMIEIYSGDTKALKITANRTLVPGETVRVALKKDLIYSEYDFYQEIEIESATTDINVTLTPDITHTLHGKYYFEIDLKTSDDVFTGTREIIRFVRKVINYVD